MELLRKLLDSQHERSTHSTSVNKILFMKSSTSLNPVEDKMQRLLAEIAGRDRYREQKKIHDTTMAMLFRKKQHNFTVTVLTYSMLSSVK